LKRVSVLTITSLLLLVANASDADRGSDRTAVLSVRGSLTSTTDQLAPDGTPDSILSIDMGGRRSWDTWNSLNNELFNEVLGAGSWVTGVGWTELGIATVPETGSWRGDAVTTLASSHPESSFFLDIAPGFGDGPGAATYSSGGILDLGDFEISNLPIGDDGVLYIQLWEDPDDVENAVDANYTGGTLAIAYIAGQPVPTIPVSALALLALLLTVTGIWLLSRKPARESRAKAI
jgi:hypothetical protein